MKAQKHYQQQQSGDVATESEWRDDYKNMDIESWFGKSVDEITSNDEANWLAGGNLVEVVKSEADGWVAA